MHVKQYTTFAMFSYEWTNVEIIHKFIVQTLDTLNAWQRAEVDVHGRCQFLAVTHTLDHAVWEECERMDREHSLYRVMVGVAQGTPHPKWHIHYTALNGDIVPAHIRAIYPDSPFIVADTEHVRALAVSVHKSLACGLLESANCQRMRSAFEQVFVSAGGAYGFVGSTDYPFGSLYSCVSAPWWKTGVRYCDIDYRQEVGGCYEFNYLTSNHLKRLGVRAANQILGPGVSLTPLSGGHNQEKYAVMRIDSAAYDFGEGLLARCCESRVTRNCRRSLLLSHEQHEAIGGDTAIEQLRWVKSFVHLPYGRAKIEWKTHIEPIESSGEIVADLQRLFGAMYAAVATNQLYVHEKLIEHCSIRDADSVVERLPPAAFKERDNAWLRNTDQVDLAMLPVTFLIRRQKRCAPNRLVRDLWTGWLAAIGDDPDLLGSVTVLEDPHPIESTTEHFDVLSCTCDATRLKQEAIDMLILDVDEINTAHMLVEGIVLGEICNPLHPQNSAVVPRIFGDGVCRE